MNYPLLYKAIMTIKFTWWSWAAPTLNTRECMTSMLDDETNFHPSIFTHSFLHVYFSITYVKFNVISIELCLQLKQIKIDVGFKWVFLSSNVLVCSHWHVALLDDTHVIWHVCQSVQNVVTISINISRKVPLQRNVVILFNNLVLP